MSDPTNDDEGTHPGSDPDPAPGTTAEPGAPAGQGEPASDPDPEPGSSPETGDSRA